MAELISTALFYIFAFLVAASAMAVITSRNPVHSVFFLIFSFFNAAGLFLLLGAEYLAMTLVIVYVGAVAVLFLFVVMMLNVNTEELREGFRKNLGVGGGVAALICLELVGVAYASMRLPAVFAPPKNAIPEADALTNTEALGQILYTDYIYAFQISGLVLLVAMIGAITLTLRHRPTKRQRVTSQIARTKAQGVEVLSVESGKGI